MTKIDVAVMCGFGWNEEMVDRIKDIHAKQYASRSPLRPTTSCEREYDGQHDQADDDLIAHSAPSARRLRGSQRQATTSWISSPDAGGQ